MLYSFAASFYLNTYLLQGISLQFLVWQHQLDIDGLCTICLGFQYCSGNPVNHVPITTLYKEEMTQVLIYIYSEVSDSLAISLGT